MSRLPVTPCICGCGQIFRRPRSLPLCSDGFARVDAAIERLPLPVGFADPRLARRNIVWRDRALVAAILAGDVAPAVAALVEAA